MKKIMFNDRYGLTDAVLAGRKTMTRRIVPDGTPLGNWEETEKMSRFKVGDVVAVAQSYTDIGWKKRDVWGHEDFPTRWNHGWSNKMFVRADLMPHQIRITDVRIERLQDISDEDCMREGIRKVSPLRSLICLNASTYQIDGPGCENTHYTAPRGAFAALIDKVSGKGTWQSNPWVFVYEFELVED